MANTTREKLRRTLDELAKADHAFRRALPPIHASDELKKKEAELVSCYLEALIVVRNVNEEDKAAIEHQLTPALGYEEAFGGKAGR